MKKVNGLTLIELIITLTVIAIISAIAAPSFAEIMADNRQTSQYNQLLTAIALTRSEAIKRGERVSLCQSSTGNSCTKDSLLWHKGWIVYTDHDQDNNVDIDEEVLLVQQTFGKANSISFGSRTRVAYYPDGLAVGGSNGTFLFCDSRGNDYKKGLVIHTSGRPRKASVIDLAGKACPS